VQQRLPQQEIQRTSLSEQAPSSTKSDTLEIATVVQQIIAELSKAVSEKRHNNGQYKMVRNLMKQNGCKGS
jgi:hypothetical protein